ncbi:ExbD/TolR family protein [Pelagibacterium lentulum]|uniref:Biopolymer transporter ExbD n=1 Tax=Pelagibacterium lentulum TaxID=2029865 RepID=A0A916RKV0_9HYPH|nr:biopolymer transporter ExbD [Pelagibacterium lentulum]GGA57502.1 hypothetical protein GCM10011499_29610 [Pelagibacterium lentulum]
MRINAAPRKRRPLSLTSLIDVIFLLLLFFMLTSTFSRYAEIPVSGGRVGSSGVAETAGILIRIDHQGAWEINGEPMEPGAVGAELQRLSDLGGTSAILLPRQDVSTQQLVEALEHLRRASAIPVSIAR